MQGLMGVRSGERHDSMKADFRRVGYNERKTLDDASLLATK